MRKLRRRVQRWRRYEHRAYGPRRLAVHAGARRALGRLHGELDRRERLVYDRHDWPDDACYDCGLSDAYRGAGDGIGSCDCPRCQVCGSGPGCDCDGWGEEYEDDSDCGPDCTCWDGERQVVDVPDVSTWRLP